MFFVLVCLLAHCAHVLSLGAADFIKESPLRVSIEAKLVGNAPLVYLQDSTHDVLAQAMAQVASASSKAEKDKTVADLLSSVTNPGVRGILEHNWLLDVFSRLFKFDGFRLNSELKSKHLLAIKSHIGVVRVLV